jgi:hypothetical protein
MLHQRVRILGFVMGLMGLLFMIAGIYGLTQVNNGYDALNSYSAAQNVTLNYNEDGELLDRGTTEGAEPILDMLENDWGWTIKQAELDPDDPLVNTPTEYMYQMAVISYHVMHGTQTVVLEDDVEYEGETFKADTYEFAVGGRYWTDFDRMHPLQGPARGQAWTGTAHGLVATLGVGAVTANTLLLGLGFSALVFFLGLGIIVLGFGLVWVSNAVESEVQHAVEVARG